MVLVLELLYHKVRYVQLGTVVICLGFFLTYLTSSTVFDTLGVWATFGP